MTGDLNGDGWIDLVVANDTVRNFFFHNQGEGRFEEMGDIAGVAYDNRGAATGAMGIDGADYRGDGSLGIGVGNFATEMSSLYVATDSGSLLFTDEAITDGIGPVSRRMLSFGLFFFDYDLDGRLDLFQTKTNAALRAVDLENHGFDFVADREHFRRMLHALAPRHLGDVNEAFDARGELDESAVIGEADDFAFHALPGGKARLRGFPRVG